MRIEICQEWEELSQRASVALESVPSEEALSLLQALGEMIARKRRAIRKSVEIFASTFRAPTCGSNTSELMF